MANIRLDETDAKLLELLQRNAKMTTKELCEELHISKTPVYERIHRLEKVGVIRGYTALIDNRLAGLPLTVFLNVALAAHDNEHVMGFKAEIVKIDEVMECYSIGGNYDILLKVVVRDLDAYNKFVFEKLTKVPGIVKMQSSFVLREFKATTVMNIPVSRD